MLLPACNAAGHATGPVHSTLSGLQHSQVPWRCRAVPGPTRTNCAMQQSRLLPLAPASQPCLHGEYPMCWPWGHPQQTQSGVHAVRSFRDLVNTAPSQPGRGGHLQALRPSAWRHGRHTHHAAVWALHHILQGASPLPYPTPTACLAMACMHAPQQPFAPPTPGFSSKHPVPTVHQLP